MVDALETRDFSKVQEANGMLSTARKMMRDYQRDIKDLMK
jgi:hypothetical protein